jgi:hypothetical protein
MQLKKASRQQSKLRIGLSWPSWSWKTHSALLVARGMVDSWDKIAIIDTENGSADLYSHLWDYNVLGLEPDYSPERYIEAIETCEKAWIEVIIIDSTSHEWEWKWWCLEINDKIAQTKFKWNTWSAWSQTTPRHQKFIEAITHSAAHIITTARSKTDTIQWEDKKVKKIWLKDIQREWFEYEMTLMFNIDRDWHFAIASKDRTNLFIDRDPFKITEETWKEILNWNLSWEKVKTLEEIHRENFTRYFEIFTNIKDLEDLEKNKVSFKAEFWSTKSLITKEQLTELSEIIKSVENWLKEEVNIEDIPWISD